MLFEVFKNLENKVFSISINRKNIPDSAENIKESQLENDFGLVEVEAGGLFVGYVKKNDVSSAYEVSLDKKDGAKELKYALPNNLVKISKQTEITYSNDSTKEAKLEDIPALKVSELKCDLFALTIKKRIEAAVEEWKGQVTDFETKEPTSFEVPLS